MIQSPDLCEHAMNLHRHRVAWSLAALFAASSLAATVFATRHDSGRNGLAPFKSALKSNSISASGESSRRPVQSPIDRLDRCIQSRFHDSEGMGMARIAEFSNHLGRFEPNGPAEVAAVAALKKSRLRVAFFLGSRTLLGPKPTQRQWALQRYAGGRLGIYAPVSITEKTVPDDVPQTWDLWDVAQRGLREAPPHGGYGTSLGSWTVDVRTVRASKPACIECHSGYAKYNEKRDRPLQLGDPLGVAIYVYSWEGWSD
jgi:hypothetical protein